MHPGMHFLLSTLISSINTAVKNDHLLPSDDVMEVRVISNAEINALTCEWIEIILDLK